MPSPFPGMDPYLEAPNIWPDLHDRLATEISSVMNATLPVPYYARLEMRPEVGIVEEEPIPRRVVPDIFVVRSSKANSSSGTVAVLAGPRTAISPFTEVDISSEFIRHPFVELRDPSRGHQLVTLIEIVSPTAKRNGPDREAYQRKQRGVLESNASLIELDFLRSGQRLLRYEELELRLALVKPPFDYLVLVNRTWRCAEGAFAYQMFPTPVTESLPCVPVPLRQGQDEVPLDLQYVFRRAYDSGPYRRGAVDYSVPPRPPLPTELVAWGEECVRAAGLV